MATRYYCDACDKEILPPTPVASRPIANLQIIDTTTGKQIVKMCCADCTKIMTDAFDNIKTSKLIKK